MRIDPLVFKIFFVSGALLLFAGGVTPLAIAVGLVALLVVFNP
jgi:hypothetical protein